MVDTWVQECDFTLDAYGWTLVPQPQDTPSPYGSWVYGSGWVCANHTQIAIPSLRRHGIVISITFPNTTVTRVVTELTRSVGNSAADEFGTPMGYFRTVINNNLQETNGIPEGVFTAEWNGSISATNIIIGWQVGFRGDGIDSTSTGSVRKVTVYGISINPFLKHDGWGDCHCSGVYAAIDAEVADSLGMR